MAIKVISPKDKFKLNVTKAGPQPKLSVAKPRVQPKLTVSPTPAAPKVSVRPTGNLSATNPRPTSAPASAPATPRDTFVNNIASAQAPALSSLQQESKNALGSFQAPPAQPQAQAPKTPTFTQPSDDAFRSAYQNYLTSLEPSKEVQAARQRYLDFVTSANLGISDLEGQGRGIPLGLIRGQQGKLAEQAEIKADRLQGDIDLASGFQGQAQTAAKARADFESAMLARQQPTLQTVGDNIVRINPQTSEAETIFSTPQTTSPVTLGEGQALVNPVTGETIVSRPKTTQEEQTTSIQEYKFAQSQGYTGSFTDFVTAKTQKDPTTSQSVAALYAQRVEQANKTIDRLQDQFTGTFGRLPNFDRFKGEDRKLLEQAEKNFINAVLRRESGAVISDSEFEQARQQYLPQPGDGKEVLAEKKISRDIVLNSLRNEGANALNQQTVTRESLQQEFPQATPQEIEALYQEELGKGNDLSRSENGSVRAAEAIGQFESGGNYKARGPVVPSGQYKGERAMGKYQIMPGNLPSWSKQALGRVVTEKEFMANPKLQDQIAQFKIGKLLEQYGNIQDVASVWFSGRPLAKAGNAKDVIGTTVPKYVKNVEAIFNRIG